MTDVPESAPSTPDPAGDPAPPAASRRTPWVQLRTFSFHPCLFPSMLKTASPDARPGDLVHVYDKQGHPFGAGLYNPRARVPLRMVHHGPQAVGEEIFLQRLDRALQLRLDWLDLPAHTNAFRVVHSDGDGLSGLVVDRFDDVLSIETHSLGVFRRLRSWIPHLHARLHTRRAVVETDPRIARIEGLPQPQALSDSVRSVRVREHGVRYEIDFVQGHKTGFFCDQRENRRQWAGWVRGRTVLDLCCYTGGFALAAAVLARTESVTGVDLDETAIAQARRNANLNQARINWVHCDAFAYARQMQRNQRRWGAVVLDPPKLVLSREETEDGRRKYEDLNRLALSLVDPGGLFVTCSCSGLLPAEEFESLVARAAHRSGRRLQFLDRTGAGPDHPVLSNCPESRYLKVLWTRVDP
ncbi:MAG TPA: class I SAM-dependent rRNA methyltransferase [Verrucomicrobiota bacterium]|nr:class I SAM-dependent rRNA methyltransferase [Verrucomicrobiota bacterium]HNU51466.1 class I SAM-dependent rRNA methyltransferase [Verrucomicrobiota bacterium]